jgi:hypothetical protein
MNYKKNCIIFSYIISLFFVTALSLQAAPAATPSLTLESRILNGESITLPVNTILESFLATNGYDSFAQALINQSNGIKPAPNPIRQALAQKWIQNAVGHIFHDELRSFLEIVVNACDASVTPDKSVGKFGMGFFSILKLLSFLDTQGTSITIDTTYKIGNKLQRYAMLLKHRCAISRLAEEQNSNDIMVTFTGKPVPKKTSSGTTITITPNQGSFSISTLSRLLNYTMYLRCYPHTPIILSLNWRRDKGQETINQSSARNGGSTVRVELSPTQLSISDQGVGIPLQTALNQLLIPSSSSKKPTGSQNVLPSIQTQLPCLIEQKGVTIDDVSHFFIAINGVIVIDKYLPKKIINPAGKVCDLIVHMPQGTQLTLARNELLIKPDGSSLEEAYLQSIITNTIKVLVQSYYEDVSLLEALHLGITTWETESAASHLNGRFTSFLQHELDRLLSESKTCFAVPLCITPQFVTSLLPQSSARTIAINPALVYHNYEPFEEFLIKSYEQQLSQDQKSHHYEIKHKGFTCSLIQGMHVFFVSDKFLKEPSMLGLRTCLFVPENFITQAGSHTALTNRLLTALPTQKLRPGTQAKSKLLAFKEIQSSDPNWKKDCITIGIDEEQLKASSARDSAWVNTITRPLSKLAPTLKECLHENIRGFNVFEILTNQSEKISTKTKEKLASLKQSYLGCSNAYFTINNADISFIYGEQPTLFTHHNGTFTAWGAAMVWLLEKFEADPDGKKIISKLLQFQRLDFARKTDLLMRNKKLAAGTLYVPGMCLGTPVAILAAIAKAHRSSPMMIKLLTTIVNHARSLEELIFIGLALNTMSHDGLKQLCCTRGLIAINQALKHYVQEKIDHELLEKFYQATWEIDFTQAKSMLTVCMEQEPSCSALHRLLRSLVNQQTELPELKSSLPPALSSISQLNKPNSKPLLLSQLVSAHCVGAGLIDDLINNRTEQLKIRVAQTTGTQLGKISQNIEAGSEKDPLEGTLIECIQNSIDATKSLYQASASLFTTNNTQARAHIDISLGWMRSTSPDASSIVLTLQDYAGFPSLKELLTDFILPDLSSKTSAQGFVGQMGNGSFKLYQDAQTVHILTRTTKEPTRCFLLTITPIRNSSTNLVEDLQLTWHDVSNHIASTAPQFFGTSITVSFQETEHTYTEMTLASTLDFLRNAIGSCNAQLDNGKPFTITLNGEQALNQPDNIKLLYEHTVKHETICKLFKHHAPSKPSYITTAGIPFRPLSSTIQELNLLPKNFCKELQQGYIVDLAPGFYQPVQSRTHLQLSEENRQALCRVLFELFFIDGVQQAVTEIETPKAFYTFLSRNFTHFLSNKSMLQLELNANDNKNFQEAFEKFVTLSKQSNFLSKEFFFDFYKPLMLSGYKLSSFYDLIDSVCKKTSYTHRKFHTKLGESYLEECREALIQRIESIDINTPAEESLESLKNDFNIHLTLNTKRLSNAFHAISDKVIEECFNEITSSNKHAIPSIGKQFIEKIAMGWVKRKTGTGNSEIDRCYAINLLFNHKLFAPLVAAAEKERQTQLEKDKLARQKLVRPQIIIKKVDPQPIKRTTIPEAHLKLLKEAWTLFCQEYFIALGTPRPEISCSLSSILSSQVAGCYVYQDKAILLNSDSINVDEQLKLIHALIVYDPQKMSIAPIIESSAFKKLYAPTIGNAPTLLHELEHARRHEKLDHDTHQISGCGTHTHGYDAQGNLVHFDACANSWGAYAIGHGLFEAWALKLKDLFSEKHD